MTKKLSLMGILCISLVAIWGTQASAWFIPSPPGISGFGWNSYDITIDIAGGGPLDPVNNLPRGDTAVNTEIEMLEAYLVLYNPQFKKESYKVVLVGVGGSVPIDITKPLDEAYPDDRGHLQITLSAPFSVSECLEDPDCFGLDEFDEDGGTAFLLYWNIIDDPDKFDDFVKNGWYPKELRIIVARVGAELTGDNTQGNPAQVFVATDEDPRASLWPDPNDPELGVIYVIGLDEEPFAFDDYYSTLAGATLRVNARHGVLITDFDRQGDPLEVVAVGSGDNPSGSVGDPTSTANGGWVTLNADGSFEYTPPDGFSDDSFTYINGDGLDESNVATVHIDIN